MESLPFPIRKSLALDGPAMMATGSLRSDLVESQTEKLEQWAMVERVSVEPPVAEQHLLAPRLLELNRA